MDGSDTSATDHRNSCSFLLSPNFIASPPRYETLSLFCPQIFVCTKLGTEVSCDNLHPIVLRLLQRARMSDESLDSRTRNLSPNATPANSISNNSVDEQSKPFTSGISSWAKSLKISQPVGVEDEAGPAKSAFARLTNGISQRLSLSPRGQTLEQGSNEVSAQSNIFGTLTKGIVDSSKSAVKVVTVKARHVVSQNKRRYQEDGFDLDMTYITENIIAMGFPAGDMSSGFFGYVEGIYRNHMEEVIRFFETHHKGKYKVYNLCAERLYDASLFEGKVACFPFDDHNCPPIHLIKAFCQSAYSWLKEDIENVVVVHCKAGMARTGLMISSLLLYLKFFPTAEESIDFYNQKRCFDGKGLVLPSQIRYVKYFERIQTYFNGENQPGRRCMLRGFRLHRCPFWIRPHITISNHNGVLFSTKKHPRTKDLSTEEFWLSTPKKGIMVFALPGEPCLTELAGDFKVHFHDRQGDFYFWLNTTMTENRRIMNTSDMDGFDKRKLPSPGFRLEIVLTNYDGPTQLAAPSPPPPQPATESESETSSHKADQITASKGNPDQITETQDKDDVFSDSDAEEGGTAKTRRALETTASSSSSDMKTSSAQVDSLTHKTEQISLGIGSSPTASSMAGPKTATTHGSVSGLEVPDSGVNSEFKAMAADASVFTFGDEEDYETSSSFSRSSAQKGRVAFEFDVGFWKLKDTEWISRQDPYVCLEYGSTKFRTRTCTDGGKNPKFQEKFLFTLIEGLREINVVVWNSNTLSSDDFIGSGKYAGEVKLIMHHQKPNKPAATSYPSAPPFAAASQPHAPPYSVPPVASAPSYPNPAYTSPATTAYPPMASTYPNPTSAYPPPPDPCMHAPPMYPHPAQSPYPHPSAYPPSPYPPPSAYPPPPYPPPPNASPHGPPGPYGMYPPPPY
ncbi:hypothetical protein V2J09_016809 [Rumex salicifolius]